MKIINQICAHILIHLKFEQWLINFEICSDAFVFIQTKCWNVFKNGHFIDLANKDEKPITNVDFIHNLANQLSNRGRSTTSIGEVQQTKIWSGVCYHFDKDGKPIEKTTARVM